MAVLLLCDAETWARGIAGEGYRDSRGRDEGDDRESL